MPDEENKPFFEEKKELKKEAEKVANLEKKTMEGELVVLARSLGRSLDSYFKKLEQWYRAIIEENPEEEKTKEKEVTNYKTKVLKKIEKAWKEKKDQALESKNQSYFKKLL